MVANQIRNIMHKSISKKSWPILYINFVYKKGQDFLDIQYIKYKNFTY